MGVRRLNFHDAITIAGTAALFGGRPGMISGATGAMALLMVPLVANHGIEYLFAATVLTGVLQVVFKAIPSPLVAIVVLTGFTFAMGLTPHTVGDMGALPSTLPFFHIPMVPFTFETLQIIFPFAIAMALVGLIESLLTAAVVDEMTDTPSCKHSEAYGQGLANIVTGFFGGMAGCAMIGQSVINVKSGGRGRLSTMTAGVVLLFLVVVLGDLVAMIPTGALVAIMITVAIGTFDWKSILQMLVMPRTETIVMVVTVGTVVITHDLSLGVIAGVVLSAVFFARSVSKLVSIEKTIDELHRTYVVKGELFFVSVEAFIEAFDFRDEPGIVEIDLSQAHIWDASAVAAIDRVVLKLREGGSVVHLLGLNTASSDILGRLATHEKPGAKLSTGH